MLHALGLKPFWMVQQGGGKHGAEVTEGQAGRQAISVAPTPTPTTSQGQSQNHSSISTPPPCFALKSKVKVFFHHVEWRGKILDTSKYSSCFTIYSEGKVVFKCTGFKEITPKSQHTNINFLVQLI